MVIALSLWTAAIAAAFVYFYRRLDRTAFPALLLVGGVAWAIGSGLIWWVKS